MHSLIPLAPVVPLLAAAVLAGASAILPRALTDALSIGCALAVTVICALLCAAASHQMIYWFGGFAPEHGVAIGISFSVDRIGAGMATLAGVIVTAALLFSARYFDEVGALFNALMLVFLAAMVGFCLTGDIFDMFVFFELMGVCSYTLTAYKAEDAGPLQGAINFAIVNSIGSFAVLTGIALIYGRTGALDMRQIGAMLGAHPADGLVRVALLLIVGGMLVKAAIVPLHFWLADAHAVAPVPVCVLFSGAMVEIALYGIARVYWTTLSGPMGAHADGLRATLVGLGVLTTLVGAVMCVVQRHLKRLLAFSTISHSGMFLIGLGLLTPAGLAAAADSVVVYALLSSAMFMVLGILLHRFGSVDEHELRGRARFSQAGSDTGLRLAAVVFVLGGLGLAAPPFFGAFFGLSGLDRALASMPGYAWVLAVVVIATALTAGAILRAGARVFAGWGDRVARHHELLSMVSEPPETLGSHDRTPVVMLVPTVLLLVAGLSVGVLGAVRSGISTAAAALIARAAHVTADLPGAVPAIHAPPTSITGIDFLLAGASLLGALLVAAAGLGAFPEGRVSRLLERGTTASVLRLRRLHSGCVNDYVAWLVAGLAVIGAALALA